MIQLFSQTYFLGGNCIKLCKRVFRNLGGLDQKMGKCDNFSFLTSTRNAIQLVTMLMSIQLLFSRSCKTAKSLTGISCFVALVMAL